MRWIGRLTLLLLAVALPAPGAPAAPADHQISEHGVGPVRLGMTVAQARRAFVGAVLNRTTDGEGLALIAVSRGKKRLMNLYAGEEDPRKKINERARIETIEVYDPSYLTSVGVHAGMPLRDVEKRYGKVKEIFLSEIEMRESASFARSPRSVTIYIGCPDGVGGRYRSRTPSPPARTGAYRPCARVSSLMVFGRSH